MWTFNIPSTDAGANDKYQQFKTAAMEYFVDLGYDVGDIDDVTAVTNDFNTKLAAVEEARVAYRNAVADKDAALSVATESVRTWAQRVKNNPLATTEMFTAFGIEPSTSDAGPVIAPSELAAVASPDGTCVLKWNPNGNVRGTTYILESSLNGEAWAWCGSTTKRRFTDNNATPGVPRFYRVRAQRAGQTSAPGSWTAIYPVSEEGTLQIAA